MKRPGPVGLVILLAFAVPVVIELRTVLSYAGVAVETVIYYPVSVLLIALALAIVYLPKRGDGSGNSTSRIDAPANND